MAEDTSHRPTSFLPRLVLAVCLALSLAAGAFYSLKIKPERDYNAWSAIVGNLRIVEGAKDQWALDQKKQTGDLPTARDLGVYMKRNTLPTPIAGEVYNINPIGIAATATLPSGVTLRGISTITMP